MQNFDPKDANFGIRPDLGGISVAVEQTAEKWDFDALPPKGRDLAGLTGIAEEIA